MSSDTRIPRRSLGRSISHINMGIRSYLQRELSQFNLGSGQYHYLLLLYRKEGVSQEYLTERSMVDKATTTRALNKLSSEGYIIRRKDPDDARRYLVFLTEKGRDLEPRLRKVLDRWTAIMLEGFTDEEKEVLFRIMERLERNSEDLL